MPTNNKEPSDAHKLFEKLVESERAFAVKCIKEKTTQDEMKEAISRFLKSRSAKKILRNN